MERTIHSEDIDEICNRQIDKLINEMDFKDDPDLNKLANDLRVYFSSLETKNEYLRTQLKEIGKYQDFDEIEPPKYFILNLDGTVKSTDTGPSNIGLEAEEIIGYKFKNLIDTPFDAKFLQNIKYARKTHKIQHCIIKIADKEEFYDLEINPLFDANQNLNEYVLKMLPLNEYQKSSLHAMQEKIDELIKINKKMELQIEKNKVTDKKLRASEKREQARSEEFAKVLDAVPAAVWISHDNKGLWITGNELSYEYLNIPHGSNASKSLPPSSSPDTFKIVKDGVELKAEDMPFHMSSAGHEISNYEFDFIYKNNATRHMMGNATPLFDENGNPRGSVSVFIDITDYKKAKIKTEKLLKELERSNRELDQFAYVTSHDLKEPLRMISEFTMLLEKRYKGKLDSDADEFIGFIVGGANRMQQLLDSLLKYSRISTNTKKFELVDMNEVLNESLNNLKIAVEESNAVIKSESLPNVYADRSQMIQLFQNLIANGIKFHNKETPIINVSYRRVGEKYYFAFKDNGIGIDPKNQARIFKVFQRLHTVEEYDGTGIGLSITKKILEHHNGSVWVKSKLNQGSTFYFSIPIKQGKNLYKNQHLT